MTRHELIQAPTVVKTVLVCMAYQMGTRGLYKFRNMWASIGQQDYDSAAVHMLDSKWARSDSPSRALRMAEMMANG